MNGIDNYKILQKFVLKKYGEKHKNSIFVKNGFGNQMTLAYSGDSVAYYFISFENNILVVYSLNLHYKEMAHDKYNLGNIVDVNIIDKKSIINDLMKNPYVIELKGKKLRLKSIGVSMNDDIEKFLLNIADTKKK